MPDYQGIGIGTLFSEKIAENYVKKGFVFIATTSSPQLIKSRIKSEKWILTRLGRRKDGASLNHLTQALNKLSSKNRITASFRFKKL